MLDEDVLAGRLWRENKEIANGPYSAIKAGKRCMTSIVA